MPSPTTLYIINHTHWDREWFLTSEYTTRWIPRLIDRLEQLVAANPDFRYLFDGQTLVVEDLLALAPEYEARVRRLVGSGRLQIGPYYCQPDWRLSSGELLMRNLQYGLQDQRRYGAPDSGSAGWLVDTFGHISQAPQIHRLFGISDLFVWRGVPRLEPYFTWQGPDGSDVFTVNLFGGYRNLYGVSHAPQVALRRLQAEVEKLAPFYPTPDLPLFDGYDLEDNPEDPVRFYDEQFGDVLQSLPQPLLLQEATAASFARTIDRYALPLPVLHGELNSGKYGATFPGALSARTYLKLMAHDCERLLFHRVEPLAALAHLRGHPYAAARYEGWARRLLQNAVHDCICGVSIDLVHEKMEDGYRRLFDDMAHDLKRSLHVVLSGFQSGDYVVSTNPFSAESWQVVGDALFHTQTGGIGVWPVVAQSALPHVSETAERFTWRNDHYAATLHAADGALRLDATGDAPLGTFAVAREGGDAYSTEPLQQLGVLRPTSPLTITRRSEQCAVVAFPAAWRDDQRQVTCDVRLLFDPSPLIRWQIDLDSDGTGLRVDICFARAATGEIYAGMPFHLVRRPLADRDLLPRELPAPLANVLLGQRELHLVADFPMHDFLCHALPGGEMLAIFTRGIRSYAASDDGRISLPLRRAVQWLTAPNLQRRVGDAGPFFYVPDARCERRVRHHLALAAGPHAPDTMALHRLNESFQNPPLIVRVCGDGPHRHWPFLQEDLPLSSLALLDGALLARFYNPLPQPCPLSQPHRRADVWAREVGGLSTVAPHEIVNILPPHDHTPAPAGEAAQLSLLTPPRWRVGPSRSRPDPAILAELEQKIAALAEQIAAVQAGQALAGDDDRLRLQHQSYALQREQLEYRLSLALNRQKHPGDRLQRQGAAGAAYLYTPDPEIAAIGHELNRLRIKRRIFDYVVQAI